VKKVVLAYSGGLDTSVAVRWLEEKYGFDVIALTADVGYGKDPELVRERAAQAGAAKCIVLDVRREFLTDYAFRSLKANALYEGVYPLVSALSRPLIAKLLVETAQKEGAQAVAHGCTGKGNDQVRFDVSVAALDPSLQIIAPVREWPMSREEEVEYALRHGILFAGHTTGQYSIDANLWGRSIECGVLEDPWVEPPEEVYLMTRNPHEASEHPDYVEIGFEKGVPVALDGEPLDPVSLVSRLNQTAGLHGVGRIDHVESRLVGIKSREVYECPGSTVLLTAHRALESFTLPRETLSFKALVDARYAELVYTGLWYSQLKEALDAFIDATQEPVTGVIRVKLFKGQATVVGRASPHSMYDYSLATYEKGDAFRHEAAMGFIEIWGLPTRVFAQKKKAAKG